MPRATPSDATPPHRAASRSPRHRAARHASMTVATARRVLRQLTHDPRTIVLLLLIPVALLVLLFYVFDSDPGAFDRVGVSLLGIFPMITMFLVTSITTLRERTSGTLERLLAMPLGKGDLIMGYALAFGALAVIQASIATATAIWLLDLRLAGSPWLLLLLALLNALLGVALGLFVSAFASSEFQAVQFMPAMIFPQVLLCGLFTPRDQMQPVLEYASNVLPMSYSVNGMTEVASHTGLTATYVRDIIVVTGIAALVLAVGAATLRRRTP